MIPSRTIQSVGIACFLLLAIASPALSAPTTKPTTAPAKKVTYSQVVHQQASKILDRLQSDNNIDAAVKASGELFDQVTLYSQDSQLDAFREASFTLRLTRQLSDVADEQRADLLQYLRSNQDLANALVFLIRPSASRGNKPENVYALLNRLREKHSEKLNAYANLTAAICVVHATPMTLRINENKVTAADPEAIWDFYVKNEAKMFFGLKNVPAELLVYVVDSGASIDEMQWALDKYAGDRGIGSHFFDIKYDYDAFRKGTEKAVTANGYTLQNILKYGGVCADQAYFATTIGKAIGVPTAYTVGSSAETGHAWVGFLQAVGSKGGWNFNAGRYTAYQGVRGNCRDPDTRRSIPDSYVSLLSELITTKPVERQNCIALTDAIYRLEGALTAQETITAAAPEGVVSTTARANPRKPDVATILGLTELALHQSSGFAPTWLVVRDMAIDKQLTLADKRHWADLLMKLGAQKYPDFTLAILLPMVQTVTDVKEQDGLWLALLPIFKSRFDLSAAIKMAQASMWEENNQPDKAGQCYMEVVDKYANAGPFILPALAGAEKMLVSTNRADKVVTLYEQAWAQTKQPQEMNKQATAQSNWYRVGKLYATKLKDAGNTSKADTVIDKINSSNGEASGK